MLWNNEKEEKIEDGPIIAERKKKLSSNSFFRDSPQKTINYNFFVPSIMSLEQIGVFHR